MKNIKILLATSNKGKIREISQIFSDQKIIANPKDFERLCVKESGSTFSENALLKALALYKSLEEHTDNLVVLADDSGLCVEALNGEPGIYSARYANLHTKEISNASDKRNLSCLLEKLSQKSLNASVAKFMCAIAVVGNIKGKYIENIEIGELLGQVINEIRGEGGFGYDPIFIPEGFDRTLAQMRFEEKNKISHRQKGLQKMRLFLESL